MWAVCYRSGKTLGCAGACDCTAHSSALVPLHGSRHAQILHLCMQGALCTSRRTAVLAKGPGSL